MRRSTRLRGDDGTDDDDMDDWSLSAGGSGHGINIVARHVTVVTAKPQSNRHSILKPHNLQRRSTFDRALRQWKMEPISVGAEDLRTVDYTTLEDEEFPPYYLAGPAPQEAYTMPPYDVRHSRRRFREQQAWARNEQSWARNESWGGGRNRGALPAPSPTPPPHSYCNHPSHYSPSRVSTPLPPPPPTPPPSTSRGTGSTPLSHVLTYCRADSCCPKLDMVSLTNGPSQKANVQYQQCPGVNSSKTFLVVPLRLRRKDDEAVLRTADAVARAVDVNSVVVVRQQKKEPNVETGTGKPPSGYNGAPPSSQHPSTQPPNMPPPPPTPPPTQDPQPPKYSSPQETGGGGGYGYKDVLPPDGVPLLGPKGDAEHVTTVLLEIVPKIETSAPIIESQPLGPEKPTNQPPEHTTVGTQYSDNETESKRSKSPANKLHSECNVSESSNPRRGASPQSKKTHSQFTISNTIEECSHEELKDSQLRAECCPSVCSSCSSDIPLALPCVYTTGRSSAGSDSKKEDAQKNNDDSRQEKVIKSPSEMLPSIEDLGPLANALREALRLCTQLQSTCIPESKNGNKDVSSLNKGRSLGGGDSTPQEDSVHERNISADKSKHKIVLANPKEIIKKEFRKSQEVLCKMSSNLQRRHEQLQKMTQLRQLQVDHVIALRKRLQEHHRKKDAKTEELIEVKEMEELKEGKEVDKKEDIKEAEESMPLETIQVVEKKSEPSNMQQETRTEEEDKKEEVQEEKMSEVVKFEPTEDDEKKVVTVEDVPEEQDDERSLSYVESLTKTEIKSQLSQSSQKESIREETEVKKKKKRKSKSPTMENHSSRQSSNEDHSGYHRPPTPYYPWLSTNRFDKSPARSVELEAQHDEDKSRTSPDQNSFLSDTCGEKESSVAEISQLYSSSQSSKDEYKPGTPTMTFFGRLSHLSEQGSTHAHSSEHTHEPQWIPVHSTKEPFPLRKHSSSTFNQSPSRRVIHLTRSSRPSSENSRTLSSRVNSSTPISSSILQHTSTENLFQRPPHWPSPFSSEKHSPPLSSVEQLKNFSGANTLSSSSMSSECMLNKRSLDLAPSRRTTPTGLPSQLSVARSTSFEVGVTSTDLLVAEISNEIGSLPPSTETTISLREGKHLICFAETSDTKKMTDKHRQLNVQRGEQIWDHQTKRGPKTLRGGRAKMRSRGEGRIRSQMRWLLPPTPPRASKTVPPAGSQDPQSTQPAIPPSQATAVMVRSTSRQNGRAQNQHARGKKHLRSVGVPEKNPLGKSALRLLPQNGNDKWSLRAATTTTMVSGSGRSGARAPQRGPGPRGRVTRPSPSPAPPPPVTYTHSPARVPHHRSSSQPHVERIKERHSLARTSRSSRSPALTMPRVPRRRTSSNRHQGSSPSGGRCAPRGVFARMNTLQELQKRNPTRRLFGKSGIKDRNPDTLVANYNDSSAPSLSTEGLCAAIHDVTKKAEVMQMRPDCGEGSPVSSRSPFRKPEDLISQIMIEASAAANANSSVRTKVKRPTTQEDKKRESAAKKEKTTVEGGDMKENQPPHSAASSSSDKAASANTQTSYLDLPLQVPKQLKIPGLAGRVRSETEKLLQELIQRNSLRDVASGNQEIRTIPIERSPSFDKDF